MLKDIFADSQYLFVSEVFEYTIEHASKEMNR